MPTVEVHISNIHAREPFRHTSVISGSATAIINGCGTHGYLLALEFLAHQRRTASRKGAVKKTAKKKVAKKVAKAKKTTRKKATRKKQLANGVSDGSPKKITGSEPTAMRLSKP